MNGYGVSLRSAPRLSLTRPRSYKQSTCQRQGREQGPSAEKMIAQLAEGQEVIVKTARAAMKVAQAAEDDPTVDLLTQRMQAHEKNAWMLRSLLD